MSGILGSSGADDNDSEGGSQIKEKLKKALALIANTASSGKVPQLDVSEPEQKEWKPTTKEEAIEFALAKLKPEKKDDVKDFEQGIKRKISNGEGLTQNEASYANRFMRKAGDIEEFQASDPSAGQSQDESGSGTGTQDKLGILGKIISAIKGAGGSSSDQQQSTDTEENVQSQSNAPSLLRKILNFYGPDQSQQGPSALPGVTAMQTAVGSLPSVAITQKLSKLINPGQSGQSQSGAQKSPYSEYPDAFQEDGVWKVVRDGKKYRIEE